MKRLSCARRQSIPACCLVEMNGVPQRPSSDHCSKMVAVGTAVIRARLARRHSNTRRPPHHIGPALDACTPRYEIEGGRRAMK